MMKGRNLIGARETHIENGCYLHNDCFTCPFPDCQISQRDLVKTTKAKAQANNLSKEGYTDEEVAKKLNKSIRTIQRWRK